MKARWVQGEPDQDERGLGTEEGREPGSVEDSGGCSAPRTFARATRSGAKRNVAACTNSSGTVCRPSAAAEAVEAAADECAVPVLRE